VALAPSAASCSSAASRSGMAKKTSSTTRAGVAGRAGVSGTDHEYSSSVVSQPEISITGMDQERTEISTFSDLWPWIKVASRDFDPVSTRKHFIYMTTVCSFGKANEISALTRVWQSTSFNFSLRTVTDRCPSRVSARRNLSAIRGGRRDVDPLRLLWKPCRQRLD